MKEIDLERLYNELSYLKDEFDSKWRKNINDLKYKTSVRDNEIRVAEIIRTFVKIIKKYDFLYRIVIENEHFNYDDHKEYMETTGLWENNEFHTYSLKVILKLREMINT